MLLSLSLLVLFPFNSARSPALPCKGLPANVLFISLYCLSEEQGTCVFCLAFPLPKHPSLYPCLVPFMFPTDLS